MHTWLSGIGQSTAAAQPKQEPAVNPKRSVFPDYIVCIEDGKKFKSLKRHLSVHYGLTPEEYREKWGLKLDLSMTGSLINQKTAITSAAPPSCLPRRESRSATGQARSPFRRQRPP
ncbi:hypothetical protein FJ938_27210 [Mesorhizobium sp. B2-4-14]|nr:hypothetical protein FJ938_27210 [Mesorhizobium sp. B2-4-14]